MVATTSLRPCRMAGQRTVSGTSTDDNVTGVVAFSGRVVTMDTTHANRSVRTNLLSVQVS